MTSGAWRRLGVRMGIGAAVAIMLFVGGPLLSLRFHLPLTIIAGLVIGALIWAFTEFAAPRRGPGWEQPHWRQRSAFVQADVRTRRLAHSLNHAQPGHGFEARRVAGQLAELTAQRLVASGRVPAETSLDHADGHLSPGLLRYLRSATAERPHALTRKALHAHLKEIDSL